MPFSYKSKKPSKSMKTRSTRKVQWRKARPSRFPSGKRRYVQTRSIAKQIQNISETKIKELERLDAIDPKPVEVLPTSGPVYFTNYCLGTAPADWKGPSNQPNFNNLGGFEWPQGTGANERVGRYLYLKRSTINMRFAMNPQSRHGPVKFRVIVYKEKRNRYNTAANGNPNEDLFIDHQGLTKGFNNVATLDARTMNFSTWLVNKRNYQVVKDFKFTLNPETISYQGGTDPRVVNQSMYPSEKNFTLSLGHYAKAEFDTTNTPTDMMYRYCMTIVSMPCNTSTQPHSDYKSYVRGTVSVVDN